MRAQIPAPTLGHLDTGGGDGREWREGQPSPLSQDVTVAPAHGGWLWEAERWWVRPHRGDVPGLPASPQAVCRLCPADRLLSLTLLAFEGLNTAVSKDRCLACIEEPFFSPLWPLLLALYRCIPAPDPARFPVCHRPPHPGHSCDCFRCFTPRHPQLCPWWWRIHPPGTGRRASSPHPACRGQGPLGSRAWPLSAVGVCTARGRLP